MNTRHADPFSPFLDWKDFGQFADDATSRFAERIAFRYRTRGERKFAEWSYARVGAEAKALAAFLRSRGLSAGDRVVIWSDNRPEWCVAYLGLVAAGYVAVPVDALLPEEDAARIYAAAEASAAIASVRHAERLAAALGRSSPLPLVVGTDGEPGTECARTVFSWSKAVALGVESPVAGTADAGSATAEYRAQKPEALASLIFTSGTTGKPKAVMLSHGGILANIAASIRALPVYPEDSFLLILPLHHTYPTTCAFLSPMAIGASNTICEKVVGKVIVDDARDSVATVVIGVPLLFDKLAAAMAQGVAAKGPAVRVIVGALRAIGRESLALGFRGPARALLRSVRAGAGFGSVRFMVSGGGPLSGRTARAFDEFGFDLVQGYGMSENGPLISVNPLQARDNRSVGLPVSRTSARIAAGGDAAAAGGAEDGAEDGVGEIQVRSPSLMLGYWRDPEATAKAFTEDGWLRTGDLGRIDDRGYIFITGRIKSLIVTTGGKNVYPEEIEALFEGSAIVREILIVGKKKGEEEGEEVAALIVPDLESLAAESAGKAPGDLELRELVKAEIARVNRSLPSYKKITDFVVRREEFEKNTSKKIKRFLYADWSRQTT